MKQPSNHRVLVVPRGDRSTATFRLGMITALVLAIVAAGAAIAASATPAAGPQLPTRASLETFEKNDLDDLDQKYQDWFGEIKVIITPDEEDAFLRMESDFQRDEFMRRFWEVRDPTPGTPQNEYRDEHYRRLEYIEKHFDRRQPRPGRDTDQGRMYILLGEPMNIKTFPNTTLAYPAEIWWYHANPRLGIPPFFYLVFFKRNGVGEYRLYSPMVDGPTALLNPAGMESMRAMQTQEDGMRMPQMEGDVGAAWEVLMDVDAELAQVSLSLIPGDYGGQMGYGSMRSQMMFGDIESIPETIMPTASWSYPLLTGMVEADVRFESLPVRSRAYAFLDPSGVPFVHYGVLTEGGRLNLNNYEDKWYLTFEVAGNLVDAQNRIVSSIRGAEGAPTKILQADLDEESARKLRSGPLQYMDRLPVVAGDYDFNLVVENNVSREYASINLRVEVPAPWPDYLRSSAPVLAAAVFTDQNYDAYGEHFPFQVGPYGLFPAIDNVFSVDNGVFVFHQVYLPAGYTGGRIPVTYRLERAGDVVLERTEYLELEYADRNGTISQITQLDTTGMELGEYTLEVDVEGDDRDLATYTITVASRSEEEIPHLHMNSGPPPTDPYFAFDRAKQLQTLGETEAAIAVLSSAVDRVEDDEVVGLQIELLMEAGRYGEVETLLRPRLIEDPNDVPLLIALAEAYSQMGRNFDAIRYYERVRMAEAEERTEILNPLASAYFGDRNFNKAEEILQLSLSIDPDQPEIRLLLQEIRDRRGGLD